MKITPFKIEKREIIPVDLWIPESDEDCIFKHCKGSIILPVSQFYGVQETSMLDHFVVATKRCYNSDEMRPHTSHYLNYFLKFYDTDKEILMLYYRLKYLIDFEKDYTIDAFLYDIKKYMLSPSIILKVDMMNRDNYQLELNYKNQNNSSLQYNDVHGRVMMKISLLMNIIIPITCHFIYIKNIENNDDFILRVYDMILDLFDYDIYNKLYETSITNIGKDKRENETLWEMQAIRGRNLTTQSLDTVKNILLNIIPKYTYDKNIICFNHRSIIRSIGYQVNDIGYEYNFISLSSSRRDGEGEQSDFDKFESFLIKQDESLYIQNKINCEKTMETIHRLFGPFFQEEVEFYMNRIDGINGFQKDLIFNLFYKYFGDPVSIKAINKDDYIKLLIAAKKILQSNQLILLPHILSGKINRIISRKNLNKREYSKLVSSELYEKIKNKYRSEKIEKYILSLIATSLSSDFEYVEYLDQDLDGNPIEIIPDILGEEFLIYTDLI